MCVREEKIDWPKWGVSIVVFDDKGKGSLVKNRFDLDRKRV
jgi:hypothetical protein